MRRYGCWLKGVLIVTRHQSCKDKPRLNTANLSIEDWKFSRVMKQSGMIFSEMHLLKIIEMLGNLGNWRLALSVVEWVYNQKDYKHHKSRFVYTKLLSVLGKARRPIEARKIFNLMREDGKLYPDMAAYHAIAVTLGQAGLVNELINIIECMRQKPSKRIKNMKLKNWDPCLEPDLVIFNAVLNACVPSRQWKGVYWVLHQLRLSGLRPTETTYGLAMEVMLKAGKYNLVHKYFETMRRGGLATKALSYKVLVRAFWEEGRIDDAIMAIRDMERRGVVGTASVYYELACCLCSKGRWREALLEVEKLKKLPHTKPLEVTFTGMILSSLDGGHPRDCISIYEYMKNHCSPNIGTINAMIKVYSRNDMFAEAKELFESIRDSSDGIWSEFDHCTVLKPDSYSYTSMLEASASCQQWEYFEYLYKEMALYGFRLDQHKHTRLLIAASRAGKCYLLEHAIDSILEAGEVPHKSLHTELICQTIYQQHFERTVAFLNSMAHASMQFNESQWASIFLRDKDRLSKEKLECLLNHLEENTDLVTEDPIPCFIRSLKSFLHTMSNDILELVATPGDRVEDSVIRECADVVSSNQANLPNTDELQSSGSSIACLNSNWTDDLNADGHASFHFHEKVDFDANSFSIHEGKEQLSESVQESSTDSEWLTDSVDRSLSELPSALDILETWKKERLKDAIL